MPELYSGDGWLAARALLLIPVLLSLAVHEFAHAWTARRLGDDTAEREGRLTLDPLAHIDPVGLLLPVLGVPFGWARPVPVDPSRFSRALPMETGLAITAAAGPLANLAIAVGGTLGMALWSRLDPGVFAKGAPWMLQWVVLLNAMLALFNLLPVAPLDGSRIVDALVPRAWRPAWNAFTALGPLPLVALLIVPLLFGANLLSLPLEHTQAFLDALFTVVAGAPLHSAAP